MAVSPAVGAATGAGSCVRADAGAGTRGERLSFVMQSRELEQFRRACEACASEITDQHERKS